MRVSTIAMWTPPTATRVGRGPHTSRKPATRRRSARALLPVRQRSLGGRPHAFGEVAERALGHPVRRSSTGARRGAAPRRGRQHSRSFPRAERTHLSRKARAGLLDEHVDGAPTGEAHGPRGFVGHRRSAGAGARHRATSSRAASMTAASTQPPLTDPAIRPSAATAIREPAARGRRAPGLHHGGQGESASLARPGLVSAPTSFMPPSRHFLQGPGSRARS